MRTVTLVATLVGHIWMPSTICYKHVKTTKREDETLRDMLLRVTNDGDFQSCGLTDATLYVEDVKIQGSTRRSKQRAWDLRFACWHTEDFKAADADVEAMYDYASDED